MTFARFRGLLYKANAFHGARNFFSHSRMIDTLHQKPPREAATRSLFRRISPIGNPKASVVPVLDQWIQEGKEVNKSQLSSIIKELRSYGRYTHALQISMWMSEKRYISLTPGDISVRLDLISKVYGIEAAENYFNNIPIHQRTLEVYGALLNCYAGAKCVEKAESLMQKMRDLGLARGSLVYNVLLSLYQQTGNDEKMENLIQEMEEKQIRFNGYTYCVLINSYAAKSDTSRIDEILKKAESDLVYGRCWSVYSSAAEGYMEAGLVNEAVTALRNAEKIITGNVKESRAYDCLITQYAKAGHRDDVLRVWKIYKTKQRVLNRGYISIISSLLRLDDMERAEQVLEEWKSRELFCDVRIPNFLIGYYSRKGLMEKAGATVKEMISRGAKLNAMTWYYMATGHLQEGKTREAVEALKEAVKVAPAVSGTSKWMPDKDTLRACLEFLKEEGTVEEAEEFVGLLKDQGIASADICLKLLDYVRRGNEISAQLELVNWGSDER